MKTLSDAEYELLYTKDPESFITGIVLNSAYFITSDNDPDFLARVCLIFTTWLRFYSSDIRDSVDKVALQAQIIALTTLPLNKRGTKVNLKALTAQIKDLRKGL